MLNLVVRKVIARLYRVNKSDTIISGGGGEERSGSTSSVEVFIQTQTGLVLILWITASPITI
jgi:hypothetical protein